MFFLPLSLQAQSGPASERITFSGSIKELAPVQPQFASSASPTLVRTELTQAEGEAVIEFSIPLKMRDLAKLQERIGQGETIAPDEMAAKYFPIAADCQSIVDWLIAQGFVVKKPAKYSLSVFASGTVAQVERAFATKFGRVQFAGTEYSSALTAPSLSAAVAGPVLGINGLQPELHPQPHIRIASGQPQELINNLPPYTVKEIATAYNAVGLGVNGAGQKIAIVIDKFPDSSDLTSFWQRNGIAQSLNHIEKVQVVGGKIPSPTGEETLDVEWSSSMAPGATVRVYATKDLFPVHVDEAYEAIINDLPAQPALHQVSLSFGLGETYESNTQMQTDAGYFASLAGSGVTVFVSSGDGGSTPGHNGYGDNSGPVQVESPANDPNVISVGGTSLHINTATGAVSSESAWSLGGGGSSQFFARPVWQTGAGVPSGLYRTVPDVALAADPSPGGYMFFKGQVWFFGGTSWGAPTWAGFCAMINQARASADRPSAGLLGPRIYPLNGTNSFRPITVGNNGANGVYNTGPAYSLCTGLGVPSLANLIGALTSPTIVTVPNPPDFDGDGKQDFLWRNTSTGQAGVWLMNGPAAKAVVTLGSPALTWVVNNVGDFDGGGKSDILWQLTNTSQYGVWLMNGTQITGKQSFTLPAYASRVCCVADFNGDGLADLVTFNRATGNIYFWKNAGSSHFVQQTSYVVGAASGWLPVGTVRLNGAMATPALILRNANTGEIEAWLMTNFTWNSTVSFGNPGNDVMLTGFGDFSGDGRADLLLYNTSSHMVGYWQTNGAQQPVSVSLTPPLTGTWIPVGAENLSGPGNAEIICRASPTGVLGAWQVSGSIMSPYINSTVIGSAWQLQPHGSSP